MYMYIYLGGRCCDEHYSSQLATCVCIPNNTYLYIYISISIYLSI